jgi:hypothetical protein
MPVPGNPFFRWHLGLPSHPCSPTFIGGRDLAGFKHGDIMRRVALGHRLRSRALAGSCDEPRSSGGPFAVSDPRTPGARPILREERAPSAESGARLGGGLIQLPIRRPGIADRGGAESGSPVRTGADRGSVNREVRDPPAGCRMHGSGMSPTVEDCLREWGRHQRTQVASYVGECRLIARAVQPVASSLGAW